MSLTKFPNGISSFGIPVLGNMPMVWGDVYFVDYRNGDDTWDGKSKETAKKTLSGAYAVCTSNNDDLIIIDGDSSVVETAMITWAKNRITVIGANGNRPYGQAAKVGLGITTAATDIATLLVTGVRNNFYGIKFYNDNEVTEGIYCVVDGGEYTHFENCEIYKSTDMDVTGAAELVCNADSSVYTNCTIGSLATARSSAVIRPNVLFTKGIAGAGKVARDVTFEGCNFWINASNTANRFIYGAAATDLERALIIKDCLFINNGASSALPAQNVAFGASLTVGKVLIKNCSSLNASTAMSTTIGVFVDGAAPTAGTSGISVQAT